MQLSTPASLLAHVRTLLVGLVALTFGACGDEAAPECKVDDDCPSGYTCDLDTFRGDCVQRVYVVRCATSFCEWPYERCVNNERCVEATDLPDSGGGGSGGLPGRDMGGSAGGMSGAGGGGAGGGGGGGPADLGVNVPAPRVLIESPFEGQSFTDQAPDLIGQVLSLDPAGRVSLEVDGQTPGIPLTADADGRFRRSLADLPAGQRHLVVVAEQGPHRAEASVTIRLDFRVVVRGGQLQAGGQVFRFVAVNAPGLLTLAFEPDGRERAAALFAQARALGVTVVRARAYDDRPNARTAIQTAPGQYSEAGLVALDRLVAAAGDAGIKLILPLVDDDAAYGGIPQYLRWAGLPGARADFREFFVAGQIREWFKAHCREILDRRNSLTGLAFREDSAILAWSVFDGLDAAGAFGDATGNQVNDFLADVTPALKATAPNQLITTGDIGFDTSPGPYGRHGTALGDAGLGGLLDGSHGVAWVRNLRLPAVDFASVQLEPDGLGFPGDGSGWANLGAAWLRGHASIAALEGKPLVVTLARLPNGVDLAQRRVVLQAWIDEVQSLELAGMVVGNFYPPGAAGADAAGWSYAPDSDPADPMNQYADQVRALADALGR